ncbi:MAG: hypothetical protein COT92_01620 [Candidatus Doudnabacteria bacterium CG10_big_fil_rev_8_21_14_0_10_42_18]|uniref:Septum formation initiator n=1 Tax=Candidatus Doudnabacteria bacterium CG10_big_fil_rev_8_21_14_0_10_42_18 TaxID=1974552 RepID=A0A2H0VBA1_9BACT|nr:MAG: hypothetical protein COT92_01620 [Candidatus Doudnabacteria bacterium CG10_big_fil_rev_8_21_14_0_10_42_18]
MSFKNFLSTKKAVFLLFIFLLSLGYIQLKQIRKQRAIDVEKNTLISQTRELEQKNKQLEDSLSYLNSTEFKERVARQQLNLKKEGEIVFNFTDGPRIEGAKTGSFTAEKPSGSNFEKWIKYFNKK